MNQFLLFPTFVGTASSCLLRDNSTSWAVPSALESPQGLSSKLLSFNDPNPLPVCSFIPRSHSCVLQLPSSEFCFHSFSYLLTTLYLVNHSLYSPLWSNNRCGFINGHFNDCIETQDVPKVNDSFFQVTNWGIRLGRVVAVSHWQWLKSMVRFSHTKSFQVIQHLDSLFTCLTSELQALWGESHCRSIHGSIPSAYLCLLSKWVNEKLNRAVLGDSKFNNRGQGSPSTMTVRKSD